MQDQTTASTSIAHGGSLTEARLLFAGAPEPVVDLSTGINPVPYPIEGIPKEAFTRLPDPQAIGELEAVAARTYGVAGPDMVVAAPGTQILISLLPLLLPQARVTVLSPTYAEHAHAWRSAGASVIESTTAEGVDCAIVCNPNNPDGRRIAAADLVALADRVRLLIVDEAFADFEAGISVAPFLPHASIVVLRSFGKAYGLAGMRLGFALANAVTAARIRSALGPWAVSGPAVEIGRRALADRAWAVQTAARLARDADRLDLLLAGAGLRVVGGTRLFRLAERPDAPELFLRLGAAGVFCRRFSAQPNWLRFGLPDGEAGWDRLRNALCAGTLQAGVSLGG